MTGLLPRASTRYLLRHPWQIGLAVVGIAVGVAVVLAIDVANESARQAFGLFTEAVGGRATHQVVGGPSGLPEDVYRRLRVDLGVRAAAPVVERDVAVPAHRGTTLHLLGIDPFAETPFRTLLGEAPLPLLGELGAFLTRPGAALLARDTRQRLGLRPGDTLGIRVGARHREVVVVGDLVPRDELSARAMESLLVTDVATAQELTETEGSLSRVDLIVPGGAEGARLLDRLGEILPSGARLVPARARSAAVDQMTRAFRLNLTALSLLALVVGMFLVYNTVTFSVVQRRELLGTLRALGVTRRQVLALVLGEAFLLGLGATAVGLPLGVALGHGLVRLVARTINDLYVRVTVSELSVPLASLLTAAALGILGTALAALAPAIEATATPPRLVLSRSTLETRARRAAPWLAGAGIATILAGVGLLRLPGAGLGPAYAGLFALLLGAACLTPAITTGLARLARPLAGWVFGLPGRMAAGALVQSLSRTGVALAALMVAVSATVGVGVMIASFRQTVVRWLETSLQADVYVSTPSLLSSRPDATLDPAVVRRLAAVPGVARVSRLRVTRVESPGGSVNLLALDAAPVVYRSFTFKAGDTAAIAAALERDGAVIVSEPFAYRHRLDVGSRLSLVTDRGERRFPVAGVYHDYGSSEGVVLMSRRTYDRLWDDRAVSSLGLYAAPGVEVDDLVETLRAAAGADQDLLIRSNRALREASLTVFDRTFRVTVVLRYLATLVAFVGVLSAVAALVLERSRDLAVLRAQGLTPRQVWGLVLGQSGLMGLVAGLLAIPVGLALAGVLIFVINRRSFGWTLRPEIDLAVLGQALLLAVSAALLAGLYPARRAARLPLPEALRDD